MAADCHRFLEARRRHRRLSERVRRRADDGKGLNRGLRTRSGRRRCSGLGRTQRIDLVTRRRQGRSGPCRGTSRRRSLRKGGQATDVWNGRSGGYAGGRHAGSGRRRTARRAPLEEWLELGDRSERPRRTTSPRQGVTPAYLLRQNGALQLSKSQEGEPLSGAVCTIHLSPPPSGASTRRTLN